MQRKVKYNLEDLGLQRAATVVAEVCTMYWEKAEKNEFCRD